MAYGHPQHWAESPYDTRSVDFELNVEPAERVGPPLRRRSKAGRRGLFVCSVLAAGAYAYVAADPGSSGLVASVSSFFDVVIATARDMTARTENETAEVPAFTSNAFNEPAAPLPPLEQPDQSGGMEITPSTPTLVEETTPPAASDGDVASTETLGAAYTDAPDPAKEAAAKSPQRKRAIDAGLGPDLPNVLLTRLSKADLKNAEYAIKTALAKTADDAKFAWPRKPSKEQALFEVRFATGASPGCRRYIVTVTKDRWTSTSAALERCGDATVHARAG